MEEERARAGYDFGDIMVSLQPDEKHYYRIKPTYNGRIFLSKPDMLGNTVVEMDIPAEDLNDQRHDIVCISPPIKMEKAIAFIHDSLEYPIHEVYAPPGRYLPGTA